MRTLKELFDKHGSVWLAYRVSPNIKAFKPLAYSERLDDHIIGETYFYNTPATSFVKSYEDFILYEQPKPKVKRYLYAVRTIYDGWTIRPYFLEDGEAVGKYMKTDCIEIKRLDSTMQEFEW